LEASALAVSARRLAGSCTSRHAGVFPGMKRMSSRLAALSIGHRGIAEEHCGLEEAAHRG